MTNIAIIQAPFYADIVDMLRAGAIAVLNRATAKTTVITVPGALEIPTALAMAHHTLKDIDGFVILGCVIRGQTDHYDLVCRESARRIGDLCDRHHVCLGFGLLTVENRDQAWVRADPKQRNLGGRAARVCLDMIALKSPLTKGGHDHGR